MQAGIYISPTYRPNEMEIDRSLDKKITVLPFQYRDTPTYIENDTYKDTYRDTFIHQTTDAEVSDRQKGHSAIDVIDVITLINAINVINVAQNS